MTTANVNSPGKRNGFPFVVPTVDASDVGPGTRYPLAMTLGEVMRLYWRAHEWELVNTGGVHVSTTYDPEGPDNSTTYTAESTSSFAKISESSRNESQRVVKGDHVTLWEATGHLSDTGGGSSDGYLYAELSLFTDLSLLPPVVTYNGDYYPLVVFKASSTIEAQVTPPAGPALNQGLSSYDDPSHQSPGEYGTLTINGDAVTLYYLDDNFAFPEWSVDSITAAFELSTDTFLPYDGHVDTADGSYIP